MPPKYSQRKITTYFPRGRLAGRSQVGRLVANAPAALRAIGYLRRRAAAKSKMRNLSVTQRRARPFFQNMIVQGVGGQTSTFKKYRRPGPTARIIKKAASSFYLYKNSAQRLTAAVGKQNYAQYGWLTFGDNTNAGPASVYDVQGMFQAINNYTGTISGNQLASRLLVESCVGKALITNQDLSNAEIHIYDIVSKDSTGFDPIATWTAGNSDEINTSSGAQNVSLAQMVGVVPQSSALFNQYFKVKQHSRIVLGAGQSHVHYVSLRPNMVVNSSYMKDGNQCKAGLTCFTVIVINGLAYNDATTVTQVSTGSSSIDIVWSKQLRYSWVQKNDTGTLNFNALPGAFTVGEKVMVVGGSAAANDAQA